MPEQSHALHAGAPYPLNDPLLSGWQSQLLALHDRSLAMVAPLTQVDCARTPAAGAWSVNQILEHLAIANGLYVVVMQRALTVQANRATTPHGEWKPTFAGRLLRRSLEPAAVRRLPSPGRSRPGPMVGTQVLPRYSASIDGLCTLMRDADGVDLRAVRFPSPFASFVRLNLGDGFAVCVTHVARHLGQIERTIDAVT